MKNDIVTREFIQDNLGAARKAWAGFGLNTLSIEMFKDGFEEIHKLTLTDADLELIDEVFLAEPE